MGSRVVYILLDSGRRSVKALTRQSRGTAKLLILLNSSGPWAKKQTGLACCWLRGLWQVTALQRSVLQVHQIVFCRKCLL